MDVRPVRSDQAYRAMIAAPPEKRPDLYRHELMAPFKEKWDCYRVPLKAAQPGGYDAVSYTHLDVYKRQVQVTCHGEPRNELCELDGRRAGCEHERCGGQSA